MSELGEVWVRIPRGLFNESREVLRMAALDLERHASDPLAVECALRAAAAADDMNRVGVGVLVTNRRGK